jgi:hypothetical protein
MPFQLPDEVDQVITCTAYADRVLDLDRRDPDANVVGRARISNRYNYQRVGMGLHLTNGLTCLSFSDRSGISNRKAITSTISACRKNMQEEAFTFSLKPMPALQQEY